MHIRFLAEGRRAHILGTIVLLLSGCASPAPPALDFVPAQSVGEPARYGVPVTFSRVSQREQRVVPVPAGSVASGVRSVAASLAAEGFEVVRADASTGIIRARSTDPELIDCGTVTQTSEFTATFPGTAPTSVLFSPDHPGGIIIRDVETESQVIVQILPGPDSVANIVQGHAVRISHATADRSQQLWSQIQPIEGNAVVSFRDGTACTSSNRIHEIVSGREVVAR